MPQDTLADLQVENAVLRDLAARVMELKIYLASAKFYNDPTVQVQDVLNRLDG